MREDKATPKLTYRQGGSVLSVGGRPVADLEPTATTTGDRTTELEMIAVPWGESIRAKDADGIPYREAFARGAFDADLHARDMQARPVRLLVRHRRDTSAAIGYLLAWEDRPEGLWCRFAILDVAEAADAMKQARAMVLSPSVGYRARQTREESGGALKIREGVELIEVSLVPVPGYAGARVIPYPKREETEKWAKEARRGASR